MKRKTAQSFLVSGGVLALLGGGSCFLAINPPSSGNDALGWAIFGGLSGILALVIAAILAMIGLIGVARSREGD